MVKFTSRTTKRNYESSFGQTELEPDFDHAEPKGLLRRLG